MPRQCFVVLMLCLLSTSVLAQVDGQGILGFKAVTGEIELSDEDEGLGLGGGMLLGYRTGPFAVEYDYSKALGLELGADPDFNPFIDNGAAPVQLDNEFDVYSHSLFLTLRAQKLFFIEAKLGYSYLRYKESGGAKRVLDEQEHAAVGLGLGLGGEQVDLGLQYLLLGKNYRQYNLVLRGYF